MAATVPRRKVNSGRVSCVFPDCQDGIHTGQGKWAAVAYLDCRARVSEHVFAHGCKATNSVSCDSQQGQIVATE